MTCPWSPCLGVAELDLNPEAWLYTSHCPGPLWVSTPDLMMVTPKPSEDCPTQVPGPKESGAPGSSGNHLSELFAAQTLCTDWASGPR